MAFAKDFQCSIWCAAIKIFPYLHKIVEKLIEKKMNCPYVKCTLVTEPLKTYVNLWKHLTEKHEIDVVVKQLEFSSFAGT